MPLNDHRRQKKLETKRARRKEGLRRIERLRSMGIRSRMAAAATWPVVRARVTTTIWQHGLGHALLVRRGPNGMTALAAFLLDVYCLGVKNVIVRIDSEAGANKWLSGLFGGCEPWVDVAPEHVRKLVEQAIGYGLSLGLAPHPGCALAQLIFGDLDSAKCVQNFTFGFEGKPNFIAGPRDNLARIEEVLSALRRTCGPDGFHYLLPVHSREISDGLADIIDLSKAHFIEAPGPDEG